MLQLNLQQIMVSKGIEKPWSFLRKCGINPTIASRLLTNTVKSINFKHQETICLALNCTIDDLFVWIPDEGPADLSKHPLQKLRQKEDTGNINQRIKNLPLDKLEEVKKYLDRLNEE
ncbi:MAG: helix-turn-helix transcriptional regulator [Daejeonella sp.]